MSELRNIIAKAMRAVLKGEHGPEAVRTAAGREAGLDVRGSLAGAPSGEDSLRQAYLEAERRAGGRSPLPGLPTAPQIVEGLPFIPGPVGSMHDVADRYMAGRNFGLPEPSKYFPLDKAHAKRIADAFDALPLYDPAALKSYDAMARETLAQYKALKEGGLKVTPTTAETYPYSGNPRAVAKDVGDRGHMAFFRTDPEVGAFGTGGEANIAQNHPLLRQSGIVESGYPMTYNDLFRVVHDAMGHVKHGYGFRAGGEDNAWRAHAAMYTPEARPAMTAETRGQNSWVNSGPYADFNKTASQADTVYSPQKVALLPDWAMKYVAPLGIGMGALAAQDTYGSAAP